MRYAVVAGLLATCLSGCSTGAAGAGPLGSPGAAARLCTAVPGVAPVVFGGETLRNGGRSAVTVDAVRLVAADGLTLAGAFLLPVRDGVLLGTRTVPPEEGPWSERRAAVGGTLDAQQGANLALLLERQGSGSFEDVQVDYTADGERYSTRLAYALEVVARGTCPPP